MLFDKLIRANDAINELYEPIQKGYTIALLGNPNVGKSTVFNELCKKHQHTGNWAGKTVELASGFFIFKNRKHQVIDLPGTYSLLAHSSEEDITRDYIYLQSCDLCLIVCDSTALERNLNLVIQTLEITNRVIVILNLIDEAEKKQIEVKADILENILKVPVVKMSARKGIGFEELKDKIECTGFITQELFSIQYQKDIEEAIKQIESNIILNDTSLNRRFISIKLLDPKTRNQFYKYLDNADIVQKLLNIEINRLEEKGIYSRFEEEIVSTIEGKAKIINEQCMVYHESSYQEKELFLDRILTNKFTGTLCMLVLLSIIFWITISGANIPSAYLASLSEDLQINLRTLFLSWNMNTGIISFVVDGIVRTCGWVISVMLPPMAIFFPLFTLLEDFGYLPRIAFHLDGFFHKAQTCGKQALTMCMGFGCNAVGVSGARIIDSPRERLIAIITNTLVPCNGRFPILISIITMFFSGMVMQPVDSLIQTLLLTGIIVFSVCLTLCISYLLSKTILRGVTSSFTLELPPYRKPQITKVIIRSIFDRTLFVLGRAISVAIPAGAIIWLLANIQIQDVTLLSIISSYLDPFAKLMGLDGVILLAFLLGFPANEIVVPIMIMGYMSSGYMMDITDLSVLRDLFINNGWTWVTAICTLLFSLVHFPCATTLLTIRKETKSWKWTLISFLLPTVIGIILCMAVNLFAHAFFV